ncbi:peptidoglycan endopeptidase [Sphingomonas sp. CGMCC 1.13654]|uniref:Peptidoglycan endopeptidase n=1 Tax=Sphingomonas chungangi TaxID=2683589 RepID=A0A838L248_9SPHN|nr:C40 family peptidase [Sphingomonas chungangi]MBA2932990.1 peptidoglycan endopeptidase [Sphingomonas chungangi]MVW56610.1 peptidoglycan endopeptidase [Sphingomonas chungangi]
MTPDDVAVIAAARACIGVRFRLHGRSRETGLDCIGLAALAFGRNCIPAGYALRGGDPDRVASAIESFGFRPTTDARPADLLLFNAGPHQLHLAILTGRGFIHADARLRRVTEVPGPPPWPVIGRWRAA